MSSTSFASINFNDPESVRIFQEHSTNMCPAYKVDNGSDFTFNINIISNKDKQNSYVVSGKLNMPNFNEKLYVKYNASSPPTYNSNFSGSGLPYPNEEVAFENTPNRGVAEVINGDFSFVLSVFLFF